MSGQEKIPCTVGILTFNSGETLRRALLSVVDFAEIIICDGGSTDETLSIAAEFGARVIAQDAVYKKQSGALKDYSGVRNQCIDAAMYEWFLYIDSDETLSPELRDEVRAIVAAPSGPLVYKMPIGIMMDGRYIKYSSNYPGYQHRFFNRASGARFIRPVHERIEFDTAKVAVGTLQHPWYIHTTREYWNQYLKETSGYRPIEVAKACDSSFSAYLRYTLVWHVRASLAIAAKAARNYLLHGFAQTLPVRGELGRAAAPLLLVWKVTICKIKKSFI